MTDCYQIRDIDNIKVQSLDYMSLLYDRNSGITHIIAEPAPQIIEALGNKALTPSQVEQYLQKTYDIKSDEDNDAETFEHIITARLDELVDMGLANKSPIVSKPISTPSTHAAQINPRAARLTLPTENISTSTAAIDPKSGQNFDPS